MEDENLIKHQQITEIFREKFQSSIIQRHHQEYLDHLFENLNQWKLETNEIIQKFIEEKINEIHLIYEQYSQEINNKYKYINQQINQKNSSRNINDQIENFNIYCQSNTIENCIRLHTKLFSKDQLRENIQLEYILYPDPPSERTMNLSETPLKISSRTPLDSTFEERKNQPLESINQQRPQSIQSILTSSIGSPVPVPIDQNLKSLYNPSKEEPFIPTRITNDDHQRNNTTRLYIGNYDTLIPVLVDKDREVYNEREKITEYSIDSIPVSQEQTSNTNPDNDMTLVHAYKVLVQSESDYQQLSNTSSSDREEEEEEDNDKKFHLKKFDQINYSTIMFQKCETEFNSMSSSTKRNELILYNSKLQVILILQHGNYQQCRQRFYLNWPKHLSPHISDITYCQSNDQFLISTWDTSHIYFFNRDLLSLNDLGKLSNDLPLRRIHCYQKILYCIISNNYLFEYQINEQYSRLTNQTKIKLFNPINHSQDTVYHLLDVTCDENYLIIIYSNEHDEIHLQSISRQTKEFYGDILLDIRQPINQSYIRIESTNFNGNFLYLNGSQQHLKSIDLINHNQGKITSIMRRHTKPTNICFLQDQRLVILYEHPHFLSVHDLNTRQEEN